MSWTVDRSKILQPDEIPRLTDLRRKARRSTNTKMNLSFSDWPLLRPAPARSPAWFLPMSKSAAPNRRSGLSQVGKGHKARKVPLTWDEGTLSDLREWKRFRLDQGAGTMTASFARSTAIPSGIHWSGGTFARDSRYAARASDANAKAN